MESLACGNPALAPSSRALCGILCVLVLWSSEGFAHAASSPDGHCKLSDDMENPIGCMPLSEKYLTAYYTETYNSLPGTDFHDVLACDFFSHDCEGLAHNISDVLGLPELSRRLVGEGSHRRLTTTVKFHVQADTKLWLEAHLCEAMIIERLPIGIFADPFELQHLTQRQIYLDAAVFGDTNLELPSALSNRSVVEVHMDIEHGKISKGSELVVELPLHVRYPPLDASGYSRVEIGAPDLFVRCRSNSLKHETSNWSLVNFNPGFGKSVFWSVPCGDEGHTLFVSILTFVSALFSALLLAFSALYFPTSDHVKNS